MGAAAIPFLIAGAAIGAGGSILSGISANKAAKQTAQLQEEQSRIAAAESKRTAESTQEANIKFRKRQKLAFLKSGITLAGSPLLVLEETRKKGAEQVEAILRSGGAVATKLSRQASITRSQGRASLTGSVISAVGGLVSAAGASALSAQAPATGVGTTRAAPGTFG